MLRECERLAREEQRLIVFLEPIALYMTRDLHEEGDGLWTAPYPRSQAKPIPLGEIGRHGDGTDLAIVTLRQRLLSLPPGREDAGRGQGSTLG